MIGDASAEVQLRERLRKIEALFAGAATPGEKAAADAAADRIRARLGAAAGRESPQEIRFSIPDTWSCQLFIALCRRYGISPFRYRRMHRQSVIVKAPRSFIEQVLWPALTRKQHSKAHCPDGHGGSLGRRAGARAASACISMTSTIEVSSMTSRSHWSGLSLPRLMAWVDQFQHCEPLAAGV